MTSCYSSPSYHHHFTILRHPSKVSKAIPIKQSNNNQNNNAAIRKSTRLSATASSRYNHNCTIWNDNANESKIWNEESMSSPCSDFTMSFASSYPSIVKRSSSTSSTCTTTANSSLASSPVFAQRRYSDDEYDYDHLVSSSPFSNYYNKKRHQSMNFEFEEIEAYESYATVASRSCSPNDTTVSSSSYILQWKDLVSSLDSIAVKLSTNSNTACTPAKKEEYFMKLQNDLWLQILTFLDIPTLLLNCSCVCKKFENLVHDNYLWAYFYATRYCNYSTANAMVSSAFALPQLSRNGIYHASYLCSKEKSIERFYQKRSQNSKSYEIATRGHMENSTTFSQCIEIQNTSMLRNFEEHGASESICTKEPLQPLSFSNDKVYYYECHIDGCCSIGITAHDFLMKQEKHTYGYGSYEHVGWVGTSYGYHGDTGEIIYNNGTLPYGGKRIADYGPIFGVVNHRKLQKEENNNVIGCGWHATGELFFTKNGKFLGYVKEKVCHPMKYCPAVTLLGFGDKATLNFGQDKFHFDIESYVANHNLHKVIS